MIKSGHRRLARSFNLCYRYIDDLIVFNNKKFLDYLKEIYPSQLTVEEANKSDHLADYLDLTFIIDSGGKLSTMLYDKRDDFDFHIVNFPFLSSNIPSGLLMVCTFHSSLDMHDAAHTMKISDVTTRASLRSTSVTRLWSIEAWWQISGSHWEIPEVSQCNDEWFISRIIFI